MPLERDTIEHLEKDKGLRHGYSYEIDPEGYIEVLDVTNGMHPDTPRTKQPKGGLYLGSNIRIRDGKLRRREGTTQYGGDVEDEVILNLIPFENENFSKLVRITKARISVDNGNGAWVDYAIGSFSERFSTASFGDYLFLANGESAIRKVDFTNHTADPMVDAPVAKYLTTFAERIIAGNIPGGPYTEQWPVNGDPTDWTGVGSGNEPLVSGALNLNDEIVGHFGHENVLIIIKKESIWLAYRQPFSDNPFRFERAFNGFGCDMPHTIVPVPGGVIFANYERRAIYFYPIGSVPQELTAPRIRHKLFRDLQELRYTQATYDKEHDEYHLGEAYYKFSPTMRKIWVYSRRNDAWTYDEGPEITAMAWATTGTSLLFINDLVGTIDAQVGYINELVDDSTETITGLFEGTNKKVFYTNDLVTLDYDGTDYVADIQFPNFGQASKRIVLQDFGAQVESLTGCSVIISVSVDASTWRNELTKEVLASVTMQPLRYRRQRITGENLWLRLQVSEGDFALESYWLRVQIKGQHR